MLEKLILKKEKLLRELDKVSEQIATERILLQESTNGRGIGRKSPTDFEKRVRAKFRIS